MSVDLRALAGELRSSIDRRISTLIACDFALDSQRLRTFCSTWLQTEFQLIKAHGGRLVAVDADGRELRGMNLGEQPVVIVNWESESGPKDAELRQALNMIRAAGKTVLVFCSDSSLLRLAKLLGPLKVHRQEPLSKSQQRGALIVALASLAAGSIIEDRSILLRRNGSRHDVASLVEWCGGTTTSLERMLPTLTGMRDPKWRLFPDWYTYKRDERAPGD